MADDRHGTNQESVSVDGKLIWTNPKITTFAARDAEVFGHPYGGVDAGIYHS